MNKPPSLGKVVFLITVIMFTGFHMLAQDKTILAKSEYMAAEEAYSNGNFEKCLTHLAKSKEHFGGSNYLIQYLEVKALYGNGQFEAASTAIKEFFEVVPKENTSSPEYAEIVKMVANVNSMMEAEQIFRKAKSYSIQKKLDESFILYRDAAERGHVNAQYELASAILERARTAIDQDEAIRWYRKAADQGNADAQFSLGVCYKYGTNGLSKDEAEAQKWFSLSFEGYRKKALEGDASAEFGLARSYRLGLGTPIDFYTSKKYYKKAAESGQADALRYLSNLYMVGNKEFDIAKDVNLALVYSLDALKVQPNWNEDADFMNNLAYLYYFNDDLQNAISTLITVVKNHPEYANGFDSLGEMYLKSGDRTRAIENYKVAASMGYENAVKWCRENRVKYWK